MVFLFCGNIDSRRSPSGGRNLLFSKDHIDDFSHSALATGTFCYQIGRFFNHFLGVGHSAGGMTLLQMAALQRDRIEAMAVVGGAHRGTPVTQAVCEELTWGSTSDEGRRLLVSHHRSRARAEGVLAWVRLTVREFDRFALSSRDLAGFRTKTLIVWGDRDFLFPLQLAFEMHDAIPDSALWVIPGEAHAPAWTSRYVASLFPDLIHRFFQGEIGG